MKVFSVSTFADYTKKVDKIAHSQNILHFFPKYSGTQQLNNMSSKETVVEEEEEDPYDTRIKKSGCAKYHYALQVRVILNMI